MALHADRDPSFTPRLDGHEVFGRFVAARLTDPEAAVIVAETVGTIATYGVYILRTRPDSFEPAIHDLITDLDVAASHCRHGLGEHILGALCDWLQARGIYRIEAETAKANEISTRFWVKRGFKQRYQVLYRRVARMQD
ncbi:MAG: GNAT family N-acetyltransferase [Labrys sp. (in: a-proteobacteria)]